MLWYHNARVNSHQRWKQMRFHVCFHLWCECVPRLLSSLVWMCLCSIMNSMKLVIPLHSLYWSIHTKDESKRGTAFSFIFGVNWLWRCGVTTSFGVFFHEVKLKEWQVSWNSWNASEPTSNLAMTKKLVHLSIIQVSGNKVPNASAWWQLYDAF